MSVEQTYEPDFYRKTARSLLTSVSRLINEAANTVDGIERRELYLEAMRLSNRAYDLLGKARELPETDLSKKDF